MSDPGSGALSARVKLSPSFRSRLGVTLDTRLVPGTNVPMDRVIEEVSAIDALGAVLDEGIASLSRGTGSFSPRDLAAFVLARMAKGQKKRGIR